MEKLVQMQSKELCGEDCDEWADVEDIEDIIDNKTTDYADLRAIVVDTHTMAGLSWLSRKQLDYVEQRPYG